MIANGVELTVSAITLAEYPSGVAPAMGDEGLACLEPLLVVPVKASNATKAGGMRCA